LALHQSILSHHGDTQLKVLIIDEPLAESLPSKRIEFFIIKDLKNCAHFEEITTKYADDPDKLRWTLKPVFLNYLLEHLHFDSAIYLDNDIYFFENSDFLFEQLSTKSFLLCPHWRISDPEVDRDWFETNFKDGAFNGGIVGATQKGIEIIKWWAKACSHACEKNLHRGLFDDQKYLDLIPAIFDDVAIIRHRGCNVAYWNRWENKRSIRQGKVFINEKWPVVFVHFTKELDNAIESGSENSLKDYWEQYDQACQHLLASQIESSQTEK
jgi:hypothetical protein